MGAEMSCAVDQSPRPSIPVCGCYQPASPVAAAELEVPPIREPPPMVLHEMIRDVQTIKDLQRLTSTLRYDFTMVQGMVSLHPQRMVECVFSTSI